MSVELGDKYIIEIDRYGMLGDDRDRNKNCLYGIKGFNSLVFDYEGIRRLRKIDNEICIEHLQRDGWMADHDEEITKAAYDTGVAEAWNFAGHLVNVGEDVTNSVYFSMNGGKGVPVAMEMEYAEARKLYDDYFARRLKNKPQTEDSIRVGDEEWHIGNIIQNKRTAQKGIIVGIKDVNIYPTISCFGKDAVFSIEGDQRFGWMKIGHSVVVKSLLEDGF